MAEKPKMYIISGPNGAGKTTAFKNGMIPEDVHFINADIIAKIIDPNDSESDRTAFIAGRQALNEIDECINNRRSFVFETTLSGSGLLDKIKAAHNQGFEVELIFFWLPNAEAAIQRVRQRVAEGGHNIPEDVIRRRYKRGLDRLKRFYLTHIDRWSVYDNSVIPPYLAVKKDENGIGVYSGYIKLAIDEILCQYDESIDDELKSLVANIDRAYRKMLIDKMKFNGFVYTADQSGNLTAMSAAELYALHYGNGE